MGIKRRFYFSSGNAALGAQPLCVRRRLAAIQSAGSGNINPFVYVQTTDFLHSLFPHEGRQGHPEPGETHIFKLLCQGGGVKIIFLDSSAEYFSLSQCRNSPDSSAAPITSSQLQNQ